MSRRWKTLFKRSKRGNEVAVANEAHASLKKLPPILTSLNTETAGPLNSKGPNLGLKVLFEPSSDSSVVADIVFLHGLTGNSYHTWHHRSSGIHWPSDLLPREVGLSRVAAFGYDADVINFWNPVSNNRISNHAENLLGALARLRERTNSENRRIFFVAHSLGGLVVEDALRISRSHAEKFIQQIEKQTTGVIFLGTPHHGSDKAAWGALVQTFAQIAQQTNKNIVSVLRPGSEMLAIVQQGFHSVLRLRKDNSSEIAITCFYEELPLKGIGEVVPKESAIIPGYSAYGIHGDHMSMTKFSDSCDPAFEAVSGELRRWVKSLQQSVLPFNFSQEDQELLRSLDFEDSRSRESRVDPALPKTFEWIWSGSQIPFHDWLLSSEPLFWVSGKPGSGKSTLMKYLAENIPNEVIKYHFDVHYTTASYFLDFGATDLARSIEGVLRSVIRQILKKKPRLCSSLLPLYEDKLATEAEFAWRVQDLEECLALILRSSSSERFLVLIDALDEYNGEDHEIANYLTNLAQRNRGKLKLCLASREKVDFVDQFRGFPKLSIHGHTEEDLRTFVLSQLSGISDSDQSEPPLISEIILKAEGVFLWVRLVCAQLRKAQRRGVDQKGLEALLQSMPLELNAFYQRIFEELEPEDREESMAMVRIVHNAEIPLSPLDLRYALHYSIGLYRDLDQAELAEMRILAVSGGLLEIREHDSTEKAVHLAHQTVELFLDSIQQPIELRQPNVEVLSGHRLMLKACINRLVNIPAHTVLSNASGSSQIAFTGGPEVPDSTFLEMPLVQYSCNFWVFHADVTGGPVKQIMDGRIFPFDLWAALLRAQQIFALENRLRKMLDDVFPKTMIELAIAADLVSAFDDMLDDRVDANENKGRLLFAAAGTGNIYIIKKLLDQGAHVSPVMRFSSCALARSIYLEHLGTARILLEHGADPNVSGICFRDEDMSPLEAAVSTSSCEAVELLGKFGADLNGYVARFGTALQAAARRGERELLITLIDSGADVNTTFPGSVYASPLEACLLTTNRDMQEEIMDILLTRGASPNAEVASPRFTTLLVRAVELGESIAVEKLLGHGAEIPSNILRYSLGLLADFDTPTRGDIVLSLRRHGATLEAADSNIPGLAKFFNIETWSDETLRELKPGIGSLRSLRSLNAYSQATLEVTSSRERGGLVSPGARTITPWIPSPLLSDRQDARQISDGDNDPDEPFLSPIPRKPRTGDSVQPLFRVSSPDPIPPSRPRSFGF